MFSIAVIVILIAFVGNILLRIFGLSGPSGSLGPVSFFAGLIVIVTLYLSLPTIKKAGLIPDFLSLEFFAWMFLIVFFILPILFLVLGLIYAVLSSLTDLFISKIMPPESQGTPWLLIIVFYLPPILFIVAAVIYSVLPSQ